jgi:hypothetical protein
MRPVHFDYHIGGSVLGRVAKIKNLAVLLDTDMSFLCHIWAVVSNKSSRKLKACFNEIL